MASDAEGFYLPPADRLSQGDILQELPWGLIPDPLIICRPNDRTATSGKAQFSSSGLTPKAGQPHWQPETEFIHAAARNAYGIVMWHDCQIDSWLNKGRANAEQAAFAGVAPVLPLAGLPPTLHDGIRKGDHRTFFFLPPFAIGDVTLPESIVDVRYIWSIKQSLLTPRLASISDTARLSLYGHLFTFLTRKRLSIERKCVHCGSPMSLDDHPDEIE